MDIPELHNRFRYHPPLTDERRNTHQNVRDACTEMVDFLNEVLPDGREKSLAVTKLEEVMFWANAAIARQP